MRASTSNAFLVSLTIHAVAAGLIIFFTYYTLWRQGPPPVIFELVAGPPTDPGALEAPAEGNSPTPVKFDAPQAPPKQPEPKVEPVATPPPSQVVPPPTKPKTPTTVAKEIQNKMKKQEKVSFRDYLKKHPTPKPAPPSTSKSSGKSVPRINIEGIEQGVKGGSKNNKKGGGGGKALTREQQNELDTYYSFLRQMLQDAYSTPSGMNDNYVVQITFDITASGSVINAKVTKSSGNRDYDDSVLDAFRRIRNLGPTPTGRPEMEITMRLKMSEQN